MAKRGRYPREFKLEAIRLLNSGDKPASELAMELGVKRTLLYRWRDQFKAKGDAAFSVSLRDVFHFIYQTVTAAHKKLSLFHTGKCHYNLIN